MMNTVINVDSITTNIETGVTTITLVEENLPVTTIVEEHIEIASIEFGVQGPPGPPGSQGARGEPFKYSDFTPLQIEELKVKGDKGDTGIGLNVDWNGTSLGVKREDVQEFNYIELKGPKGDNLNYNNLTLDEKNEILSQYDNVLGNTSYANIFLNTLLS